MGVTDDLQAALLHRPGGMPERLRLGCLLVLARAQGAAFNDLQAALGEAGVGAPARELKALLGDAEAYVRSTIN